MKQTTVRRVVGGTAALGVLAVVWLLGNESQNTPDAAPVDSTQALVDLQAEVALLDAPGAVVDASGTIEGRFMLTWINGGLWTDSYYPKAPEPGYEPPMGLRAKYSGQGWELTLAANNLQTGRPAMSGVTVIATFAGMTFFDNSGLCEIEVLQAPFTVIDAPWASEDSVYYQAEEATARLTCFVMLEVRTREPLSIEMALRIPPTGWIGAP